LNGISKFFAYHLSSFQFFCVSYPLVNFSPPIRLKLIRNSNGLQVLATLRVGLQNISSFSGSFQGFINQNADHTPPEAGPCSISHQIPLLQVSLLPLPFSLFYSFQPCDFQIVTLYVAGRQNRGMEICPQPVFPLFLITTPFCSFSSLLCPERRIKPISQVLITLYQGGGPASDVASPCSTPRTCYSPPSHGITFREKSTFALQAPNFPLSFFSRRSLSPSCPSDNPPCFFGVWCTTTKPQ